ncbi:MAG: GrpB family protein [Actinomycetota bacterium]|nr:GrpB family protein [Actinomycetota bacterium]
MNDDPVKIIDYDPRWPELFEQERQAIELAIGTYVE